MEGREMELMKGLAAWVMAISFLVFFVCFVKYKTKEAENKKERARRAQNMYVVYPPMLEAEMKRRVFYFRNYIRAGALCFTATVFWLAISIFEYIF